MKKVLPVLALFLSIAFVSATAWAFPNENFFWEQFGEFDGRYHHELRQDYREPYTDRVGYRYRDHSNYNWYGQQQLSRIRVFYTDENSQQIYRVDLRPYNGWIFLGVMKSYHGNHTYLARYQGSRDQAYFWIGKDTIMRLVIGERGRDLLSVWRRAEAERYALDRGYVLASFAETYREHFDYMPADITKGYLDALRLHD